jgi:hypothetical protein
LQAGCVYLLNVDGFYAIGGFCQGVNPLLLKYFFEKMTLHVRAIFVKQIDFNPPRSIFRHLLRLAGISRAFVSIYQLVNFLLIPSAPTKTGQAVKSPSRFEFIHRTPFPIRQVVGFFFIPPFCLRSY